MRHTTRIIIVIAWCAQVPRHVSGVVRFVLPSISTSTLINNSGGDPMGAERPILFLSMIPGHYVM